MMSQGTPANTPVVEIGKLLTQKRTHSEDIESEDKLDNKRQKTDGLPYLAEVQGKISRLVSKILASIYYDINYICIMRNNARWTPNSDNVTNYRLQYRESVALLDRAVSHALDPTILDNADPTKLHRRLEVFIKELGWKTLSICILAEGFRRACREIRHGAIWKELMLKISENKWSLEVFARSRDLDWRGQLLKYVHIGIPALDAELKPFRKMWEQHPHHIVQSVDKRVKRPYYQGRLQVHVDDYIFDGQKWGFTTQDPTLRKPSDGKCNLCLSRDKCDCKLDFSAGSLVELVERPGTGTGVRALTNFKKGDILAPFVGEICPPDWNEDLVYSLAHVSKTRPTKLVATISPRNYGNWTRYLAHSCDASTGFFARTIGDRTVMTVEATRDISAFEDLTVDYGEGYWNGRTCMCGQHNCISKRDDGTFSE